MAVTNDYSRNMDLKIPVSASLIILLILIMLAEARLFLPKKAVCSNRDLQPSICNSTVGYPEKKFKKLLKRNSKVFEKLKGSVVQPAETDFVPKLRNWDNIEEGNVCRTRKVTMKPTIGFGPKMDARYIANIPGFEQVVEYEICVDQNKACFENEVLPLDYRTYCHQTYTMVRLVSLTKKGKLEYAAIKVPSTCVCTYKKHYPDYSE